MGRVGLVAILLFLALGVAASALAHPRADTLLYLPVVSVRSVSDAELRRPYGLALPADFVRRNPLKPRLRHRTPHQPIERAGQPHAVVIHQLPQPQPRVLAHARISFNPPSLWHPPLCLRASVPSSLSPCY